MDYGLTDKPDKNRTKYKMKKMEPIFPDNQKMEKMGLREIKPYNLNYKVQNQNRTT